MTTSEQKTQRALERAQKREEKKQKREQARVLNKARRKEMNLWEREAKQNAKKQEATIKRLNKAAERQQPKILNRARQKEMNLWEREAKQNAKVQARVMDDLKWRGKKKFRDTRRKLENKLRKIQKEGKNIQPILVSDAIRKNTSKYMIPGGAFKDPNVFLERTTAAVGRLINSVNSVGKKVHVVMVCKMVRTDARTGKDTIAITHFSSKTHSMISDEDFGNEYPTMTAKVLESFAAYQKLGSGWRLHSIEMLEIFITKFRPLQGKSYKPLPKIIAKKKAVINMENDDDQCFKWAVTRALHLVERDGERISKILKKQAEKYDWSGIEFPTKLKDIHIFEKK